MEWLPQVVAIPNVEGSMEAKHLSKFVLNLTLTSFGSWLGFGHGSKDPVATNSTMDPIAIPVVERLEQAQSCNCDEKAIECFLDAANGRVPVFSSFGNGSKGQ